VRVGRLEEGVKILRDAIRLCPAGGRTTDFLFLAIAEAQRGHDEESKGWMKRAKEYFDHHKNEYSWVETAEFELLYSEVEGIGRSGKEIDK
jgi:hypothetical protein